MTSITNVAGYASLTPGDTAGPPPGEVSIPLNFEDPPNQADFLLAEPIVRLVA